MNTSAPPDARLGPSSAAVIDGSAVSVGASVSEPEHHALSTRHLLGIDEMPRADAELILRWSRQFKDVNLRQRKKVPTLRGRTVVNFFFENSTRTRLSFEVAAKRLSADAVNFSGSASSTKKGETFLDTTRIVEAMDPDVIVVRHSQSGAAGIVANNVSGRVINAGDGEHEHPTQALLDAFTMLEHFGRTPKEGLTGKRIVIIGDVLHSRVARSNLLLLPMLGADVVVAGPGTLLPQSLDSFGVSMSTNVDEAIVGADAVMMLRIQKERLNGPYLASDREYRRRFGLTLKRAETLKSDALILHPGPLNRGVEIAAEVADSGRSVILDQARNGIAVRMALLFLLTRAQSEGEGRA